MKFDSREQNISIFLVNSRVIYWPHRQRIDTRMHFSRMRTARSSSHQGGLPQCMLWAWRSPSSQIPLNFLLGCRPGDPMARSPSTSPLGVGLETPLARSPSTSPCVWAWKSARHARKPCPPLETCCKACWDTTCNTCGNTTPPPPP